MIAASPSSPPAPRFYNRSTGQRVRYRHPPVKATCIHVCICLRKPETRASGRDRAILRVGGSNGALCEVGGASVVQG